MRIFCLLLGVIWFGQLAAHPLHLSVVNVDYSAVDTSMSVTIKVFYDDFTLALNHNFGPKEDLQRAIPNAQEQLWATAYLNKNLLLKLDGENCPFDSMQWQSSTREGNALWLRFKTKVDGPPKHLAVTNTILNDVYFDQQNIFFFADGKLSKNNIFGYRNTQLEFMLDD